MNYSQAIKIISDISGNNDFMLIEYDVLKAISGNCSKAVQRVVADFLTNDFNCERTSYISAMTEPGADWHQVETKQAIIAFAKELTIYAEIIAEQKDENVNFLTGVINGTLKACQNWDMVLCLFRRHIVKEYSNCGRCIDVKYSKSNRVFTIRDAAHSLFTVETADYKLITKQELFNQQVMSFNFELNADEIVQRGLEVGFIIQPNKNKDLYITNHNYKAGC
ncbi:hypothetical protein S144_3 [Shewanella sp. phage 1/44]|uniref:hypothetical protein n=1 Tax=Shewanella sp. phage 1/44 TaxID=1458862 RepID=UPI0004F67A9D|nr:hypothetical protein S144_3 [Shewanella sp. phage 1/44]AHK11718.1 hypothetical protein S144_3 [Shewanella sp. phage 1/44]